MKYTYECPKCFLQQGMGVKAEMGHKCPNTKGNAFITFKLLPAPAPVTP